MIISIFFYVTERDLEQDKEKNIIKLNEDGDASNVGLAGTLHNCLNYMDSYNLIIN